MGAPVATLRHAMATDPLPTTPPVAGPKIWRDGELIDHADATVHVLSHAANRGTEVFDVLRVVDGPTGPAAVGLRDHVARFDQSMELMGMDSPYGVAALEGAVAETVGANPGAAIVKLVAAWVEIAPASRPVSRRPTVFVAAMGERTPPGIGEPVRLARGSMPKLPATILPPALKVAAAYAAGVRQQLAAADQGYDDVVFTTLAGKLAEATTQSMLVVAGDRILAPPLDSVLDGITRRLLLDLARLEDLTIEVRDLHWDEVVAATELVMTSTSVFVRPVAELDGHSFDAPGPIATRLQARVDELIAGGSPLTGRWLTSLTP